MSTVRIQVRRGTSAEWASVNPILAAGEMGLESDTNFIKFGNGTNTWTALGYANEPLANLQNTLAEYIPVSDMGVANGVATLNSSGKVPASQLDITELSQDAVAQAITAGTGILKNYDDAANTLTISADTSVLATKAELVESAQDAMASALSVGTNLTKNYDDAANTLSITLANSPSFSGTLTASEIDAVTANITGTLTAGTVNVSNLNVTGTTTTVNSTNLSIADPLIYMGTSNSANTNDLGFVGHFNDGTYQHTGLVRDHSDGTWKLFSGVITEPASGAIDLTTHTKDNLEIGLLSATSANIGSVTNSEIQQLHNVTRPIQTQLDEKLSTANAASTYAPISSPTFLGTVTLPGGTVTSTMIAPSTITNVNISSSASIDPTKVAGTAVTQADTGSVTSTMIADNSVTSSKILNGTILDVDISPSAAIAQSKISGLTTALSAKATSADPQFTGTISFPSGSISGSFIVDETITSAKITNGTIATIDIADGAINSAKIADNSIVNGDISPAAAIAYSKLNLTGSITSSDIVNGTIINEDISASAAIAYSKLALVNSIVSADIADSAITSAKIADGTIIDADINASAAIAQSKVSGLVPALAALAPIASPTFTGTVSGITKSMVGLSNVDNTTDALKPISTATQAALDAKSPLASPTFTGTVILPSGTVTSGMILDGTIVNADINTAAAIAATKVAGTAVTQADTGTISTAMIADSAITSAKIADGTIVDVDINASAAIAQSKISGLSSSFALKADLASPTFTGTPVAPTAAAGTNTTQLATTAYVRGEVTALVNGASAALDTLGELAAALTADEATAATLSTLVGTKAPLASPTFTGTVTIPAGANISGFAKIASPTFTGTVTIPTGASITSPTMSGTVTYASGGLIQFSDGTQQSTAGVASLTTIGASISANTNLSSIGLTARDQMIPVAGTVNITIPANATTAYPVGTSIDFYQASGSLAAFVADSGVTFINTPGLKLRATGSVATAMKVATNTWLIFGDLSA